jgi:hypothetical protein
MIVRTSIVAVAALCLVCCSFQKIATSSRPTAFIASTGVDTSGRISRLPFDHAWRDPAVDFSRYQNIVVRPVATDYLHKDEWIESSSHFVPNREAYLKQCQALAGSFTSHLRLAFESPVCAHYLIENASKPNTLVLEVALTEVTFGRPAGYVGSMAVPGGSAANAAASAPVVAFEARVKDGATGKVLATAADRRGARFKLIDFNQLTYNRANDEICNEWAGQLMQAGNKELFPKVTRAWFTPF